MLRLHGLRFDGPDALVSPAVHSNDLGFSKQFWGNFLRVHSSKMVGSEAGCSKSYICFLAEFELHKVDLLPSDGFFSEKEREREGERKVHLLDLASVLLVWFLSTFDQHSNPAKTTISLSLWETFLGKVNWPVIDNN